MQSAASYCTPAACVCSFTIESLLDKECEVVALISSGPSFFVSCCECFLSWFLDIFFLLVFRSCFLSFSLIILFSSVLSFLFFNFFPVSFPFLSCFFSSRRSFLSCFFPLSFLFIFLYFLLFQFLFLLVLVSLFLLVSVSSLFSFFLIFFCSFIPFSMNSSSHSIFLSFIFLSIFICLFV